ncbi:hypothetical protein SEPCBS57363_003240 [Sporothrix epigloea]|uniref:Uncharacterized protein n=1 Tax=Sporothrix epigloea TaxID=1892477 RepID=A0ABP0DKD9_9PEZI
MSIHIYCNSTLLRNIYSPHLSHSTNFQAIQNITSLLEVARIATLYEIATGVVDTAQQTQRTTLEWLLHQVASHDFHMGEREIHHRITRHTDLIQKRLWSVGLQFQKDLEGVIYIRSYRTSASVFGRDDSTCRPLREILQFLPPTEMKLTAINVAKGLSIYQYMESFSARHTAAGTRRLDQVAALWDEICTLYASLLGQPLKALKDSNYHPQSMDGLVHNYFALSKAQGVEAKLTAILLAERAET